MDSTLPQQLIQLHPFEELFQIHRLIKTGINSTTYIKFAQYLSTTNKKQYEILTKLHDNGIKMYMCKHYSDDECDILICYIQYLFKLFQNFGHVKMW